MEDAIFIKTYPLSQTMNSISYVHCPGSSYNQFSTTWGVLSTSSYNQVTSRLGNNDQCIVGEI